MLSRRYRREVEEKVRTYPLLACLSNYLYLCGLDVQVIGSILHIVTHLNGSLRDVDRSLLTLEIYM